MEIVGMPNGNNLKRFVTNPVFAKIYIQVVMGIG